MQVRNSIRKYLWVVFRAAQHGVAPNTQQPSYFARLMAVVNDQYAGLTSSCQRGFRSLTDCTNTVLRVKHLLIFNGCNTVTSPPLSRPSFIATNLSTGVFFACRTFARLTARHVTTFSSPPTRKLCNWLRNSANTAKQLRKIDGAAAIHYIAHVIASIKGDNRAEGVCRTARLCHA
jgi:hypothetical protein